MQDPDIPPAVVEEGETGGAAGVVHPTVAVMDVIANSTAVSIPLPWIIITAPAQLGAKGEDGAVPASGRHSRPAIPNRCRIAKMPPREYLLSSTTFFSWRKFRRLRAS